MLMSVLIVAAAMIDVQSIPAMPIVPGEVMVALDNAEKAGVDLNAFAADVAYRKDDALLGSRELRMGRIVYAVDADAPARLAVVFEMRVINGRQTKERKRIVFDGRWLVESDPQTKQFIKRELVKEGDTVDPMRLGGPFPLPVGQKRSDVLARFNVTMIDDAPEAFLTPKDTDPEPVGLRLVPKADTPLARDWSSIDVWYDQLVWLPVGVKAVEVNGDTRNIRLRSLDRNPELGETEKASLSTSLPGEGWTTDIQLLDAP